jgi:hypothetical protein
MNRGMNKESKRKGEGRRESKCKEGDKKSRREQELQKGERKCKGKQNEQERTE